MILKRGGTSFAWLLMGMLVSTILILAPFEVNAEFEEWVPYVPHRSQIELDYRKENGTSYMEVSIWFPSTGFNVSDWGTPTKVGNNISVNALIYRWTGYDFPLVITKHYTYSLGNLSAGEYLFTFKTWLYKVENMAFTVPLIVPDDYPTIQEAINNANEGDTIFVRNGTYYEHVVVNKSVSLVGEDRETTIVDGRGSGYLIDVFNASRVVIKGFSLRNSLWGVRASLSNETIISDNMIVNCNGGIRTVSSSKNTITFNTIMNNFFGIYVTSFLGDAPISFGNMVEHNNVINNSVGLVVGPSSNDTIIYNNIENNSQGLSLGSSNGTIMKNNLTNNREFGINLYYSSRNILMGNIIRNSGLSLFSSGIFIEKSSDNALVSNSMINNSVGILLIESSNNLINHNNLINNTKQVLGIAWNNTWDNGSEGNYWSNYIGSDLDGDGIGDTYLPWEGVDYYPLMNPYWNPADINHDLIVDIRDIALAAIAFGSYPSHPRWNPHADITGPEYLVPDGKVDIRDIALIAKNFGKTYS